MARCLDRCFHRRMAKGAGLPEFIRPQLSQLIERPPEGDGWAHEVKYDGYRIHARLAGRDVKLLTRTGLDWTDPYPATAEALAGLRARGTYLDGELCAVRPDGTTSFAEMEAATDSRSTHHLIYFAFDLLYVNRRDMMRAPAERQAGVLPQGNDTCPASRQPTGGKCWRWSPTTSAQAWAALHSVSDLLVAGANRDRKHTL